MVAALASPPRPSLFSVPFPEVLSDVHHRASLAYPDQVLPLARLHATEAGTIDVPGMGVLALNDWSRSQTARLLGVKWDRWFSDALVSPQERAEELNRRFARHPSEMKIRARRYAAGETGEGDGILRAFVGPGYTPIDDVRVFDRIARVLGPRTDSFSFVRETLTDEMSQYVAVSKEEVDLSGNGHPDLHRHGFTIVNSEVGARALAIVEYLYRLICTNGMVIALARKKLFYRVHRKTEDESIDRDLAYAFALLPERWEASAAGIRSSRRHMVEEPEATLRNILAGDLVGKHHTDAVLAFFRKEPEPTRFGLVQAITRAAQNVGAGDRLALETLAGSLIMPEAA